MSKDLSHAPRLYVEADLSSRQSLALSAPQAHYVQNVMRLKAGDAVRLFNGRDGEWHGEIEAVSKKGVSAVLFTSLRPQTSGPDLWLCCAPIKKAHFDYMIEKATELGASVLQPILTARTQVRAVNIERSHAIMIEAAEQSERLDVPVMHEPKPLADLVRDWPKDRLLIVAAETGDAAPTLEAFAAPKIRGAKKAAIMTGPEGGFAEEEFALLRKVPGVLFIRLGPRILRADTAALSALALWQAACGDWKNR